MSRRPSSIDRLPEPVREQIGKLRQAGRTIDEILAKLHEMDADVSRSALGRAVMKIDQVAERMRESEAMANALADRFGDEGDEKVSRLNFQLMNSLIFKTLLATHDGEDSEGEGLELSPKDAKFLAGTLKDLAAASKTNAERLIKVRAEVARQIAKENAEKLDAAAQSGQIDAEAAEAARRILGFA